MATMWREHLSLQQFSIMEYTDDSLKYLKRSNKIFEFKPKHYHVFFTDETLVIFFSFLVNLNTVLALEIS